MQVYVGDRESSVPRPVRELAAFAKVSLDPGEARTLAFDLPPRAFAFWGDGGWRVEAGDFEIAAGFSATDLRVRGEIALPASRPAT